MICINHDQFIYLTRIAKYENYKNNKRNMYPLLIYKTISFSMSQ